MSTSNVHNQWLKTKKHWLILTALVEKDLSLKPWAKAADVDLRTLLKHRDELLREGAVDKYVNQQNGITYYHLKDQAALVRVSVPSPEDPEYVVRQTVVPEQKKIPFKGTIPAHGRTVYRGDKVQSSIVVGRPYWKVYGEDKLAEFRREYSLPTLTQQERDDWLEKVGRDAEFTVGPPPVGRIPDPGLKVRGNPRVKSK